MKQEILNSVRDLILSIPEKYRKTETQIEKEFSRAVERLYQDCLIEKEEKFCLLRDYCADYSANSFAVFSERFGVLETFKGIKSAERFESDYPGDCRIKFVIPL